MLCEHLLRFPHYYAERLGKRCMLWRCMLCGMHIADMIGVMARNSIRLSGKLNAWDMIGVMARNSIRLSGKLNAWDMIGVMARNSQSG
jgi:hypothetical protein